MSSSVMNSAIDVITWLGGSCCVPRACRRRPSTTMIRTKLVVISRIAGARLTTVSSSITCSVELMPPGLVHCCGRRRGPRAAARAVWPERCGLGVRGGRRGGERDGDEERSGLSDGDA